MDDLQRYAKEILETNWQEIANKYTVGFTNLIGLQQKFSFVSDRLSDIKNHIIIETPILLYQTRQSPPENMVVAIPYQIDPNPLSCRIVSTNDIDDIELITSGASF